MSDCNYCSGSGCVYCRADPEKVEAPEIVDGRMNFKDGEVCEFVFDERDDAEIMISYLNRRCSFDQFCPEIIQQCKPDCISFKKAYIYPYDGKFKIGGFRCGNPKLTFSIEELNDVLQGLLRQVC